MHRIQVLLHGKDAPEHQGCRAILEDNMASIGLAHQAEECPGRRTLCTQPLDRSCHLGVKLVVRDYAQLDAPHDEVPEAAWVVKVVDWLGHVRGGVPIFAGQDVEILECQVLGLQGRVVSVLDGQVGVRGVEVAQVEETAILAVGSVAPPFV